MNISVASAIIGLLVEYVLLPIASNKWKRIDEYAACEFQFRVFFQHPPLVRIWYLLELLVTGYSHLLQWFFCGNIINPCFSPNQESKRSVHRSMLMPRERKSGKGSERGRRRENYESSENERWGRRSERRRRSPWLTIRFWWISGTWTSRRHKCKQWRRRRGTVDLIILEKM